MATDDKKQEEQRKLKQKFSSKSDILASKKKDNIKAVALQYDVDKDSSPKIVALGKGMIAEEIVRVAEDNKVPIYQDKALVDLLSKLQINDEVPPEMFTLVAEIFAFVYQLEQMSKKREKIDKKFKK